MGLGVGRVVDDGSNAAGMAWFSCSTSNSAIAEKCSGGDTVQLRVELPRSTPTGEMGGRGVSFSFVIRRPTSNDHSSNVVVRLDIKVYCPQAALFRSVCNSVGKANGPTSRTIPALSKSSRGAHNCSVIRTCCIPFRCPTNAVTVRWLGPC